MDVAGTFNASARRLGIASAAGTVLLSVLYVATLVAGLLSLHTPQQPIADPLFSILELLIILTMPLMVALMVSIHAWAPSNAKVFSLTALVFMSLLAGITCSVHFVILTVSRQAAFSKISWMPLFLSFEWPSIPYALDILGWDVFFAISVLFAAPVFSGNRIAASIRVLLVASGALAPYRGAPDTALRLLVTDRLSMSDSAITDSLRSLAVGESRHSSPVAFPMEICHPPVGIPMNRKRDEAA